MIYIDSNLERFTDKMYRDALPEVSGQRREHAERFLKMDDRKRSVIAYRLLQEGLKIEHGMEGAPEFEFNENGKPFLSGHPDIYFSLSHCDKAVACGLSDRLIGIDVETIRPFDRHLADYICNDSELSDILASPRPDISFTALWTKKESLCKMLGGGLPSKAELKTLLSTPIPHTFITTANIPADYILTACHPQSPRFPTI